MVNIIVLSQKRVVSSLQSTSGPKGWSYVQLSALAEVTGYSTEQLILQFHGLTKHHDQLPVLVSGWENKDSQENKKRLIMASRDSILRWIRTNRPYFGTSLEVVSGWANDVLQLINKRESSLVKVQTAQYIRAALSTDSVAILQWREDSPRDLQVATHIFQQVQGRMPKAVCLTSYQTIQNDDDDAITWHWAFYLKDKVEVNFVPFGPEYNARRAVFASDWEALVIHASSEEGGLYLYKTR